jgi:NAD-reducing hydrogenase large subunit
MSRTITIDPVTRIEGHARITLYLNELGNVKDAQFHVTQMRGFEQFVKGRPFHEMPSLMARICGICPVSHLMASAKACDSLLAVSIPPVASKLRQIMNLAQIAQSHALSFFYLSAPDFLLGMDAPPEQRNLLGIAQTDPQFAREGVKLRQVGQQIIEILGGKRIHPAWVVPGGVNAPLTEEKRAQILAMVPECISIARSNIAWFKTMIDQFPAEIATFANFPTLFMGLVSADGTLDMYSGRIRITDSNGNILEEFMPADFEQYIGETDESFSFLKSPYYLPKGYPNGIYRVGPMARLNIAERCNTPLADAELVDFRRLPDRHSSFHFHYARLIEILYAFEKIEQLLNEDDILSPHVRAFAQPNRFDGIGVSEAPRGTLMHHYTIDENGLIESANLVIATGHNNLAMNRGILQVAQYFVKGNAVTEGALNRVEAVIRAYDPCLSCSTHDLGNMPLHIELRAPDGALVDEVRRG